MGPPASNVSFIAGEVEFEEGSKFESGYPAGTIMLIKKPDPRRGKKRKATVLPQLTLWDRDHYDEEFGESNGIDECFPLIDWENEIIGVGVLHDDVVPRISPTKDRPTIETTAVIVHGVCNILSVYKTSHMWSRSEGKALPHNHSDGKVSTPMFCGRTDDAEKADKTLGDGLVGPLTAKVIKGKSVVGQPPMRLVQSHVEGDNHLRVMLNSAAIFTFHADF